MWTFQWRLRFQDKWVPWCMASLGFYPSERTYPAPVLVFWRLELASYNAEKPARTFFCRLTLFAVHWSLQCLRGKPSLPRIVNTRNWFLILLSCISSGVWRGVVVWCFSSFAILPQQLSLVVSLLGVALQDLGKLSVVVCAKSSKPPVR